MDNGQFSTASTPLQLPKGKLALTRDPRVYQETIPLQGPENVRVVGLDLASSCGVTFCDLPRKFSTEPVTLYGGQWNLEVSQHDTHALRYIRLKHFLEVLSPNFILYEEVKYTAQKTPPGMKSISLGALVARAVSGAQVVHGLASILTTWAEERSIPCEAVPIGTLKKYATGKGSANKADMIRACNSQFGTTFDVDSYESTGVDNIADSMFLCAYGVHHYSEGLQDGR